MTLDPGPAEEAQKTRPLDVSLYVFPPHASIFIVSTANLCFLRVTKLDSVLFK